MADLLEVSNADRAKLLASAGAGATASGGAGGDDGLSVADIKTKAASADAATLSAMLAEEKAGKNRSSAVKAIEDAIAKAKPADEGNSGANAGTGASSDQAGTQEVGSNNSANGQNATNTASPSDKNAQPVPAAVTAEQAAAAFGAWFGETDEEGERATRRGFVEQIVGKLGARVSELEPAKARQAVFYLRRKRAGLTVDFDAAYDFDGSPTQDAPAAAAAPAAEADDDLL
ncbi:MULTISPECIES: hypothetical protein [unclassified Sphingopyxis]|uniref:hypothetical protein n=1 Tax=unclassified Sphingopyxis TaxID=2614943 RepID=UPI00285AA200|nr:MULTISPECIES: hypothetical protein [unclassified Sphingopyxis]MDR7182055.1 hypothetical protein [Sphingopyxis sp. BE249]